MLLHILFGQDVNRHTIVREIVVLRLGHQTGDHARDEIEGQGQSKIEQVVPKSSVILAALDHHPRWLGISVVGIKGPLIGKHDEMIFHVVIEASFVAMLAVQGHVKGDLGI